MSRNQKNTGSTSTFYKPVKAAREIRTGYLYKSPPKRFMTERSWKKRYFVLFKINEQEHHLKYFKGPEDMDKPLGEIDLTQISLLYASPENHPKWLWIQRSFKCSPSCVLYIRSGERDYFLVGEDREAVDSWFSDLFDALKNRPHRFHTSEEISNGRTIVDISKPLGRSTSACTAEKSPKMRSMSDPSSNTMESIYEKAKDEDSSRRRSSEPVQPHYVYPRPFNRQIPVQTNGLETSTESMYETMQEIKTNHPNGELDREVEEANSGNLMKTVTDVFDRMRKQISPLPSCIEERANDDRNDKRQSSEFSSSSSDNGAISPVEILDRRSIYRLSSTESIEPVPPKEKDIEVKQADLKKHLTLTEVDGKPSVSGWTGQPQTACLFHKGDQILAINDLHTGNLEDVNMYLSKSLKNEVKVTILRLPGCQPLHLATCFCSDAF
ncbi:pleckstrin homology domain-containing family S member 1 [Salarias fasciatus]|uniref:PH domain-containing protein n=1 Tax=Salarias fasciatus TaxID=181472 RepID=A0A672JIP5_SALFA|nr:pleckstrin homology domain-containing family S member 1 [Salarias fasciatus]